MNSEGVRTKEYATFDVVVLGGGCAGLWLSYFLALDGRSCLVLDQAPFSSFASTRNQGWLQSGSLYVAYDEPSTAEVCRAGFNYLVDFVRGNNASQILIPGAIQSAKENGYILYRHRNERDTLVRNCRDLNIEADPISVLDIQEPILNNNSLKYAAVVQDRWFDSHVILASVAEQAKARGSQHLDIKDFEQVRLERRKDVWLVSTGQETIAAKTVVLACGVYIIRMLERLFPKADFGLVSTKVPVLVMRGTISNSMLISRQPRYGSNLVPFKRGDDSGVTICISNTDQQVSDHNDIKPAADAMKMITTYFRRQMPGIQDLIQRGNFIRGHIYACQKMFSISKGSKGRHSRNHIIINHGEEQLGNMPNLISFYSGKFTSSSIAAQECASLIQQLLPTNGSRPNFADRGLNIAHQRYYDPSTHILELDQRTGQLQWTSIN